jgi:hypothetical protein
VAAPHGAAKPQSRQTSLDVVKESLDNIGFDLPEEAAIPSSSCSLIGRTGGQSDPTSVKSCHGYPGRTLGGREVPAGA